MWGERSTGWRTTHLQRYVWFSLIKTDMFWFISEYCDVPHVPNSISNASGSPFFVGTSIQFECAYGFNLYAGSLVVGCHSNNTVMEPLPCCKRLFVCYNAAISRLLFYSLFIDHSYRAAIWDTCRCACAPIRSITLSGGGETTRCFIRCFFAYFECTFLHVPLSICLSVHAYVVARS